MIASLSLRRTRVPAPLFGACFPFWRPFSGFDRYKLFPFPATPYKKPNYSEFYHNLLRNSISGPFLTGPIKQAVSLFFAAAFPCLSPRQSLSCGYPDYNWTFTPSGYMRAKKNRSVFLHEKPLPFLQVFSPVFTAAPTSKNGRYPLFRHCSASL